jgi:ABC-type transporter MlaC component
MSKKSLNNVNWKIYIFIIILLILFLVLFLFYFNNLKKNNFKHLENFYNSRDSNAEDNIKLLLNELKIIINNNISENDKLIKFTEFCQKNIDLETIKTNILSDYTNIITESKKNSFYELFDKYLIKKMYENLKTISDKSLEIIGSSKEQNNIIVNTSYSPFIKIDFKVCDKNNKLLIQDIIAQVLIKMSIVDSQKKDFKSFVGNKNIDELIDSLRAVVN